MCSLPSPSIEGEASPSRRSDIDIHIQREHLREELRHPPGTQSVSLMRGLGKGA